MVRLVVWVLLFWGWLLPQPVLLAESTIHSSSFSSSSTASSSSSSSSTPTLDSIVEQWFRWCHNNSSHSHSHSNNSSSPTTQRSKQLLRLEPPPEPQEQEQDLSSSLSSYRFVAQKDLASHTVLFTIPALVLQQQQQQQPQEEQPVEEEQPLEQSWVSLFCHAATAAAAHENDDDDDDDFWRVVDELLQQQQPLPPLELLQQPPWIKPSSVVVWSSRGRAWLKDILLGDELEEWHFGIPPQPEDLDDDDDEEDDEDEDDEENDDDETNSNVQWVVSSSNESPPSLPLLYYTLQVSHPRGIVAGQALVLDPRVVVVQQPPKQDDDKDETTTTTTPPPPLPLLQRWIFATGYIDRTSNLWWPEDDRLAFDITYQPQPQSQPVMVVVADRNNNNTTTTTMEWKPVLTWHNNGDPRRRPPPSSSSAQSQQQPSQQQQQPSQQQLRRRSQSLLQLNWLQAHYQRLTRQRSIGRVVQNPWLVFATAIEQAYFLAHYHALVQALQLAIWHYFDDDNNNNHNDSSSGDNNNNDNHHNSWRNPDRDDAELQEEWTPQWQQQQPQPSQDAVDTCDSSVPEHQHHHHDNHNTDASPHCPNAATTATTTTKSRSLDHHHHHTEDAASSAVPPSPTPKSGDGRRRFRRRRLYDELQPRLDDGLKYEMFKETPRCGLPEKWSHHAEHNRQVDFHMERVQSFFQTMEWREFYQTTGGSTTTTTTTLSQDEEDDDDHDDTDWLPGHHRRRRRRRRPRRDTCLFMDDLFHSCTGTRPHVHETMVHYPASFLPHGLRRVLYVGGGDLVLLHEILKYNSTTLELVVGMELDQVVVRTSFEHYGIPPHFDDPKVQWWFGDASKSLALLDPDEYFGTFDLVIIDLLSYVFESLRVRVVHDKKEEEEEEEEYTLIDFLMKLLRPNHGILIRQEDFVERNVVDFAKYTVDLDLTGLPYMCHQSLTMGSNDIDFLERHAMPHNKGRFDHGVETLVYQPWDNHLSTWSGYRTNHGPTKHGVVVPKSFLNSTTPAAAGATASRSLADNNNYNNNNNGDDDNNTKSNATRSVATHHNRLGVLVVMEAEATTVPLDDLSLVQSNIRTALTKAGLTEIGFHQRSFSSSLFSSSSSSSSSSPSGLAILTFWLKEGYVVARLWPSHKYCAFDLQLWNSIRNRQVAMTELIQSVGSDWEQPTTSSYQITTGGMNGFPVPVATIATTTSETKAAEFWNSSSVSETNHKSNHNNNNINHGEPSTATTETGTANNNNNNKTGGEQGAVEETAASDYSLVLQELMSLTVNSNPLVFVVCPEASNNSQSSSHCSAWDALRTRNENEPRAWQNLIPLWTCPQLTKDNDDNDDDNDDKLHYYYYYRMIDCERRTRDILREATGRNHAHNNTKKKLQKISGLFIDPETPKAMGQILHKIFNNTRIRTTWLAHPFAVVAPLVTPSSLQPAHTNNNNNNNNTAESTSLDVMAATATAAAAKSWRHALLERFRAELFRFNPVFHSQVAFHDKRRRTSTVPWMEVGIFSAGDHDFYSHLSSSLAKITIIIKDPEKEEGDDHPPPHYLAAELVHTQVGLMSHIPDYNPPLTVSNNDYDMRAARDQYWSQRTLGHQTIWQWELEPGPKLTIAVGTKVLVNEEVHPWDGIWYMGVVIKHSRQGNSHEDDGDGGDLLYHVALDKGGEEAVVGRDQLLPIWDEDQAFSSPLSFGELILQKYQDDARKEPEAWYQGFVIDAHRPDGKYRVQCYDTDRVVVERRDLIRRIEPLPPPPPVVNQEGKQNSPVVDVDVERSSPLLTCHELQRIVKLALQEAGVKDLMIASSLNDEKGSQDSHNVIRMTFIENSNNNNDDDDNDDDDDNEKRDGGCIVAADFAMSSVGNNNNNRGRLAEGIVLGNLVATWDGRSHVDVNLFVTQTTSILERTTTTTTTTDSVYQTIPKAVQETMQREFPRQQQQQQPDKERTSHPQGAAAAAASTTRLVSLIQKDEQPRGFGRVVVDVTQPQDQYPPSSSRLWFGRMNDILMD
ncbi:hypothetical protein ACA910_011539 [Epithemia clementina (nom. ined.)]